MVRTEIRGGCDAVAVAVDHHGVRLSLGPDGISASASLDFGEARLLAESILEGLADLLEVVLEVAQDRGYAVRVGSPALATPDAMWWVVHDGESDEVRFERLSRRERDMVLMANPQMWPVRDRLFVKRFVQDEGRMDVGFLRPDRGPAIFDGPDLVASFESFEGMVDAGWVVD